MRSHVLEYELSISNAICVNWNFGIYLLNVCVATSYARAANIRTSYISIFIRYYVYMKDNLWQVSVYKNADV